MFDADYKHNSCFMKILHYLLGLIVTCALAHAIILATEQKGVVDISAIIAQEKKDTLY